MKQRIHFLCDGLDHLKLTRDVLQFGYLKKRTPEQQKQYETLSAQQQMQYETLSAQLQQMRKQLTPKHVVWGEVGNANEVRRHIPTFTKSILGKQENLAGI